MTLHPDWKAILTKAWSVRLWALSTVFACLEQVVPFLDGFVPPRMFAVLSIVAAVGGISARVIQQLGIEKPDGA